MNYAWVNVKLRSFISLGRKEINQCPSTIGKMRKCLETEGFLYLCDNKGLVQLRISEYIKIYLTLWNQEP